MSRNPDFDPCTVVEHDSGRYSLTFNDLDEYAEIFEEQGWEGTGYAWEGVVQVLLAGRFPQTLDEIEFDSESGVFSVYSESLDQLQDVAVVIREATVDLDLLAEAIIRADEQGLLE